MVVTCWSRKMNIPPPDPDGNSFHLILCEADFAPSLIKQLRFPDRGAWIILGVDEMPGLPSAPTLGELEAVFLKDPSLATLMQKCALLTGCAKDFEPQANLFARSGTTNGSLLTPREKEVMHWVAEGKRNQEIASILGRSPATIKSQVEAILRKLGAETRGAAAALWRTAI